MRSLPIYLIDAFTAQPFTGNAAGVCLLPADVPTHQLQQVAQELNQSETAFLRPVPEQPGTYYIRYFTPTQEIHLCGHARLAAASLVLQRLQPALPEVTFRASQHVLTARRDADGIAMQLPLLEPEPLAACPALLEALGIRDVRGAGYTPVLGMALVEVASREIVQHLRPDFARLRGLVLPFALDEVVVTSRDAAFDFVSRCFCPWIGIDEDPVTGAAHALLAAYWQPRLGKASFVAAQISRRGGQVHVRIQEGKTAVLTGATVFVLEGQITLPDNGIPFSHAN